VCRPLLCVPIREQNFALQSTNNDMTRELTVCLALDQGPQDLFPQGEWEDHREFEAGSAILRRVHTTGSYTDRRVDDRQSMTPSSVTHTAMTDRHITGQHGTTESVQPMSRTHMCQSPF
jgi:hypothetical protein